MFTFAPAGLSLAKDTQSRESSFCSENVYFGAKYLQLYEPVYFLSAKTTVKNEIFCFFSSLSSRLDTKLLVSRQVLAPATPPAPTHHATVIVPAPAQPVLPHHVTVVTMGPASVINTASTSRQNLDTIVQVRRRTSWSKKRGCGLPPLALFFCVSH